MVFLCVNANKNKKGLLPTGADQCSSDRRGADFPAGGGGRGGALVRYQRG